MKIFNNKTISVIISFLLGVATLSVINNIRTDDFHERYSFMLVRMHFINNEKELRKALLGNRIKIKHQLTGTKKIHRINKEWQLLFVPYGEVKDTLYREYYASTVNKIIEYINSEKNVNSDFQKLHLCIVSSLGFHKRQNNINNENVELINDPFFSANNNIKYHGEGVFAVLLDPHNVCLYLFGIQIDNYSDLISHTKIIFNFVKEAGSVG